LKGLVKIPRPFSTLMMTSAAALAVLAIIAYILTIGLYLIFPNYYDHGEPTVASISWLWMQGHDLYPNWETADIYGSVYGPILFLVNGIALHLSPTVFTSKVLGVCALFLALGGVSILLKQKPSNSLASVFLFGSLLMLFVPFDQYVYWNRPEPFLILVSVLALMTASRMPILGAPIAVGVLAGLAAGLKIHGFIYTIPAAVIALARVQRLQSRVVMGVIASGCAVSLTLLSYLGTGASIDGHIRFLKVVLRHGWSATLFRENILFAAALTAPIAGVALLRTSPLNRVEQWYAAALYISIAMMTVLGAKPGGGAFYLLPMIPSCIYGVAVLLGRFEGKTAQFALAIFICFFVAYSPRLLFYVRSHYADVAAAAQSEPTKIAELETYLESYPEAQIGISDATHYRSYFYRILSVFSGRPVHVDFSVWMELANGGVSEEHVSRFIKACEVPVWILPSGAPFTMVSKYSNLPMLSEEFRRMFLSSYQQVEIGHTYQVWKCESQAP
jgi:hypothetical protein